MQSYDVFNIGKIEKEFIPLHQLSRKLQKQVGIENVVTLRKLYNNFRQKKDACKLKRFSRAVSQHVIFFYQLFKKQSNLPKDIEILGLEATFGDDQFTQFFMLFLAEFDFI